MKPALSSMNYTGRYLEESEDQWNMLLSNADFTSKDGRTTKLDAIYLRGQSASWCVDARRGRGVAASLACWPAPSPTRRSRKGAANVG